MEWRPIKSVRLGGEPAKALADIIGLEANHHAVEAILDVSWLRVRWQDGPDAEIFEYAVPASDVVYVIFWPSPVA